MEAPLPAANNVTVYALVKVCFLSEYFVVKEVFFFFCCIVAVTEKQCDYPTQALILAVNS